jgi:hypothetical protein
MNGRDGVDGVTTVVFINGENPTSQKGIPVQVVTGVSCDPVTGSLKPDTKTIWVFGHR